MNVSRLYRCQWLPSSTRTSAAKKTASPATSTEVISGRPAFSQGKLYTSGGRLANGGRPTFEEEYRNCFSQQSVDLDVSPTRRPFFEGWMSWRLNKFLELTLVSGISGSSVDSVVMELKQKSVLALRREGRGSAAFGRTLVARAVCSTESLELVNLLRSIDATARLACHIPVYRGDFSQRARGEVYFTDAWLPHGEQKIAEIVCDEPQPGPRSGECNGLATERAVPSTVVSSESGDGFAAVEDDGEEDADCDLLDSVERDAAAVASVRTQDDSSTTAPYLGGEICELLRKATNAIAAHAASSASATIVAALQDASIIASESGESSFEEDYINRVLSPLSCPVHRTLPHHSGTLGSKRVEFRQFAAGDGPNSCCGAQTTIADAFGNKSTMFLPIGAISTGDGCTVWTGFRSNFLSRSLSKAEEKTGLWKMRVADVEVLLTHFWSQRVTRFLLLARSAASMRGGNVYDFISTSGVQVINHWLAEKQQLLAGHGLSDTDTSYQFSMDIPQITPLTGRERSAHAVLEDMCRNEMGFASAPHATVGEFVVPAFVEVRTDSTTPDNGSTRYCVNGCVYHSVEECLGTLAPWFEIHEKLWKSTPLAPDEKNNSAEANVTAPCPEVAEAEEPYLLVTVINMKKSLDLLGAVHGTCTSQGVTYVDKNKRTVLFANGKSASDIVERLIRELRRRVRGDATVVVPLYRSDSWAVVIRKLYRAVIDTGIPKTQPFFRKMAVVLPLCAETPALQLRWSNKLERAFALHSIATALRLASLQVNEWPFLADPVIFYEWRVTAALCRALASRYERFVISIQRCASATKSEGESPGLVVEIRHAAGVLQVINSNEQLVVRDVVLTLRKLAADMGIALSPLSNYAFMGTRLCPQSDCSFRALAHTFLQDLHSNIVVNNGGTLRVTLKLTQDITITLGTQVISSHGSAKDSLLFTWIQRNFPEIIAVRETILEALRYVMPQPDSPLQFAEFKLKFNEPVSLYEWSFVAAPRGMEYAPRVLFTIARPGKMEALLALIEVVKQVVPSTAGRVASEHDAKEAVSVGIPELTMDHEDPASVKFPACELTAMGLPSKLDERGLKQLQSRLRKKMAVSAVFHEWDSTTSVLSIYGTPLESHSTTAHERKLEAAVLAQVSIQPKHNNSVFDYVFPLYAAALEDTTVSKSPLVAAGQQNAVPLPLDYIFSIIQAYFLVPAPRLFHIMETEIVEKNKPRWKATLTIPAQCFGFSRGMQSLKCCAEEATKRGAQRKAVMLLLNLVTRCNFPDEEHVPSFEARTRCVVRSATSCQVLPDKSVFRLQPPGGTDASSEKGPRPAPHDMNSRRVSEESISGTSTTPGALMSRYARSLSLPRADGASTDIFQINRLPQSHRPPEQKESAHPLLSAAQSPRASLLEQLRGGLADQISRERGYQVSISVHVSRLSGLAVICHPCHEGDDCESLRRPLGPKVLHCEPLPVMISPLLYQRALITALVASTSLGSDEVVQLTRQLFDGQKKTEAAKENGDLHSSRGAGAPWPSLFVDAAHNYRLCCTTFFKRYAGWTTYESDDQEASDSSLGELTWLTEERQPSSSSATEWTFKVSLCHRNAPNSKKAATTAVAVRTKKLPFSKVIATAQGRSRAISPSDAWKVVMRDVPVGLRQEEVDALVLSTLISHAKEAYVKKSS